MVLGRATFFPVSFLLVISDLCMTNVQKKRFGLSYLTPIRPLRMKKGGPIYMKVSQRLLRYQLLVSSIHIHNDVTVVLAAEWDFFIF